MDLAVTTTAQPIGGEPMLIQNLGTGNVYVDDVTAEGAATTSGGVKIANGGWMALGESQTGQRSIVGDASADCRVISSGQAHS